MAQWPPPSRWLVASKRVCLSGPVKKGHVPEQDKASRARGRTRCAATAQKIPRFGCANRQYCQILHARNKYNGIFEACLKCASFLLIILMKVSIIHEYICKKISFCSIFYKLLCFDYTFVQNQISKTFSCLTNFYAPQN